MSKALDETNLEGAYAGCLTRVAAFVIDVALITVVIVATVWLTGSTLLLFGIDINACPRVADADNVRAWICLIARAGLAVYGLVFAPIYLLLFWSLPGQTVGKALAGLRVVRYDGKPMSFLTAVRRLLGYVVTLLTFGIGFAWLVLDDRRQALHDKIAGTVVIYAWEARVDQGTVARLRARLRQWRGMAPTLYVADPSALEGKTYALVRVRLDAIGQGLETWGQLGKWNEQDPTSVVRAALVEKQKDGNTRVVQPKYLGSQAPPQPDAFKTVDGRTMDMVLGEVVAELPPKAATFLAIVEQSLLTQMPDADVVSQVQLSRPIPASP